MSDSPKSAPDQSTWQLLVRVAVPAMISIAICIGSAIGTSIVLTSRIEERVAGIKDNLARHDAERKTEYVRIVDRVDNHEQRLTRLEAHYDQVQETLREISSDVKIILRGGQQ